MLYTIVENRKLILGRHEMVEAQSPETGDSEGRSVKLYPCN